jgi:hypothetical protein
MSNNKGTNLGYTVQELKEQNKGLVQIIEFLEQSNLSLGTLVCMLGDALLANPPQLNFHEGSAEQHSAAVAAYEAFKGNNPDASND